MKIVIDYEASWRNSFLDGDNNQALPKQGRKFIGSMTALKNADNYIERKVTIDTVMGVLNRLIGDQRKLYQARSHEQYYFREIENKVSFIDKPKYTNLEIAYIRNITGSTDQNSYTGMIRNNDPIFISDYSPRLWSVLAFTLDELSEFVIDGKEPVKNIQNDPLSIMDTLEHLNKLKPVPNEGRVFEAYEILSQKFPKFKGLNNKGLLLPISLYCSSLYLQLGRLATSFDVSSALTKAGGLSGISNNGFTKKDFMNRYTTGDKKKIWGNPYIKEEYINGEGKTKRLLKKVGGQLSIDLDLARDEARNLERLIECAGVSSFYLGKKGLAYVSSIRI